MTSVDIFNLCPPEETLCFTHGDTFVWERIARDEDAVIIDITGFIYVLTVDENKDPPDATTNIFSITTGVIGAVPGANGQIQFQFSVANWAAFIAVFPNLPETGFYDLEQTDLAGDPRTVRKGKFKVEQDITKP